MKNPIAIGLAAISGIGLIVVVVVGLFLMTGTLVEEAAEPEHGSIAISLALIFSAIYVVYTWVFVSWFRDRMLIARKRRALLDRSRSLKEKAEFVRGGLS